MKPTNPITSCPPQRLPAPTIRRGVLVMLLSVAAFTVNSLLLRYIGPGQRGVRPEVPLLFRAVVGMVIVLVVFGRDRRTRILPVFRDRLLIWRGATGLAGTAAFYWTIPELGAGMATLICNTYVVFASVIAVLALGEALTVRRLVWLAAAFGGIALLVGPGEGVEGFSLGFHELIALLGAVVAAVSVVLVRKLVARHSIGTIYLAQCVWIFLPLVVLAGPRLPGLEWLDVGIILVAATAAGAGQLAMNEGYRCLSVSSGASMQMLWPVLTTVGGWWLFAERLIPLQIAGAVLVLAAIWRITAGRR